MSPPAVWVTGMGVVTPLARGVDALWSALLAGRSAARDWPDLAGEGFRVSVACRVEGVAEEGPGRGRALAVAAARAAVEDAGAPLDEPTGVYVGTTMGESAAFEAAAAGAPLCAGGAGAGAFPRAVREALGVRGPARAYATACAAGNYAIGAAAAAVRAGTVRVAVAGGVDPFSRIALVGFSRSRAMAAERCRPFDRARSGMQLGEGAAFLVLERADAARARGARPLAAVASLGLSCDAHHATAPRPDGAGMAAAMHEALRLGGAAPAGVGWVCAHGSGTVASDAAEACALGRVFGGRPPPVSGIKGALGHSLGAATAVEAVVTVLALRHGVLPPTANFAEADPAWGLDVVAEARPAPGLRRALNCGYAFGGLNSALLLEAV